MWQPELSQHILHCSAAKQAAEILYAQQNVVFGAATARANVMSDW